MKCMLMLCKQSHRLCSVLFPRNNQEFSKNIPQGYFWFTFTWTLKFSYSEPQVPHWKSIIKIEAHVSLCFETATSIYLLNQKLIL